MARTRTPQPTAGDALIPGLDRLALHPRTPWILAAVHFALMAFIGIRYHIVGDYGVETDFFWSYVPAAKQVLHGSITIEDFRGPLYPIVLALFQVVFRDHFLAGILLSTASASAAVVMCFLLFRRFVRAEAAFLGTLLMAVGSFFVQYTYTAGTDMLFTALSLAGAAFLFRNEQRVW
ncbi:MAG: glycosyltransferase family 39 protein, partial [Bacteroidota bacterium]